MAPSNYYLFVELKESLNDRRFRTDDELNTAESGWLAQMDTHCYADVKKLLPLSKNDESVVLFTDSPLLKGNKLFHAFSYFSYHKGIYFLIEPRTL